MIFLYYQKYDFQLNLDVEGCNFTVVTIAILFIDSHISFQVAFRLPNPLHSPLHQGLLLSIYHTKNSLYIYISNMNPNL